MEILKLIPDGPSYIMSGEFKGRTLADVLMQHPEYLGIKVKNGELPVLVKFIDAKNDLSVQVHPDDEYARQYENQNGKKRELHFDKAIRVMNMGIAPEAKQKSRLVKHYPGCSRELLCRCKYFETERIQVTKGFSFSVKEESFQILMCLDGYGQVETMDADQKPIRFCKGETMFLPAGLGRCLVFADAMILKIRC